MNGFRSIIVTILLVVMAIEMVLPLFSHRGFNAAGWRTYTIVEIGARVSSTSPAKGQGVSIGPTKKPAFLVVAQSTDESPPCFGLSFLWAGSEFCFDLFDPLHGVISLTTAPHQSIHLPPEVIPPRSAQSVM